MPLHGVLSWAEDAGLKTRGCAAARRRMPRWPPVQVRVQPGRRQQLRKPRWSPASAPPSTSSLVPEAAASKRGALPPRSCSPPAGLPAYLPAFELNAGGGSCQARAVALFAALSPEDPGVSGSRGRKISRSQDLDVLRSRRLWRVSRLTG